MVNENIDAPENEVEDPDVADSNDSDTEDSTEEVQQPDEMALLKQEVALLKAQNTKVAKDFSAAVGRYQSLLDRFDSGKGDTDKLAKQVQSSIGAVDQVIDTILGDENFSPEIRARAQAIRASARANTELDGIKAELEALKNRKPEPPTQQTQQEDLSPIEQMVHTMINSSGLKIDDFDWNEAGTVYGSTGDAGVIGYFTNKIAEKRAEAQAAERRQSRKTSASKPPEQAGASRTPEQMLGDSSLDLDQRRKILADIMAGRA